MILLNLVVPMSIINAIFLIVIVTYVVRSATEAVDIVKDYSIVLQALMKEANKRFVIKQQPEAITLKNSIMALAYLAMLFLLLHSIVNMITAMRTPGCKLTVVRLVCEHITSLIRVYFCLLGCLIFVAIIALDLTVCMPTPIFPTIYLYTKGSKMNTVMQVEMEELEPASYFPTTESMKMVKRSVRITSGRYNENDFDRTHLSICDQCDLLRLKNRLEISGYRKICTHYNKISEVYYREGFKAQDNDEIIGISKDDKFVLSCDSGNTYVTIGTIKPPGENARNTRIKRQGEPAKPEELEDFDENEKYENIPLQTKEGHYQTCQKHQELLKPGLFLVFFILTCITLILVLSRCERDPCLCGAWPRTGCPCETRVRGGTASPDSTKYSEKTNPSSKARAKSASRRSRTISANASDCAATQVEYLCSPAIIARPQFRLEAGHERESPLRTIWTQEGRKAHEGGNREKSVTTRSRSPTVRTPVRTPSLHKKKQASESSKPSARVQQSRKRPHEDKAMK